MVAAAYGDAPASVAPIVSNALDDLYQSENDPDLGTLRVKNTRRYRFDARGNKLETLDALEHKVTITYDGDGISPVEVIDGGSQPRPMEFDPVVQQATLVT